MIDNVGARALGIDNYLKQAFSEHFRRADWRDILPKLRAMIVANIDAPRDLEPFFFQVDLENFQLIIELSLIIFLTS